MPAMENPYLEWSSFAGVSPQDRGIELSVAQDNSEAWVVAENGSISCENYGFAFNSGEGAWYNVTPSGVTAAHVSAGGNYSDAQQAWMIDTSGRFWVYNSPATDYCYDSETGAIGTWTRIYNNSGKNYPDNHGTSVSVGYNNTVWATDSQGGIWTYY
jgi:hypothetical protein